MTAATERRTPASGRPQWSSGRPGLRLGCCPRAEAICVVPAGLCLAPAPGFREWNAGDEVPLRNMQRGAGCTSFTLACS